MGYYSRAYEQSLSNEIIRLTKEWIIYDWEDFRGSVEDYFKIKDRAYTERGDAIISFLELKLRWIKEYI